MFEAALILIFAIMFYVVVGILSYMGFIKLFEPAFSGDNVGQVIGGTLWPVAWIVVGIIAFVVCIYNLIAGCFDKWEER